MGDGKGVNEEEDFSNSLEAFRQRSSTKNHKKAESKASRELLFDAFKATDAILKEDLDTIMELVKPKNIEFYKQYHASRVIWDIGGSHAPKNSTPETAAPVQEQPAT